MMLRAYRETSGMQTVLQKKEEDYGGSNMQMMGLQLRVKWVSEWVNVERQFHFGIGRWANPMISRATRPAIKISATVSWMPSAQEKP